MFLLFVSQLYLLLLLNFREHLLCVCCVFVHCTTVLEHCLQQTFKTSDKKSSTYSNKSFFKKTKNFKDNSSHTIIKEVQKPGVKDFLI